MKLCTCQSGAAQLRIGREWHVAPPGRGTGQTAEQTFIVDIPYRAGPARSDLIAGNVDMMSDGLGSSAQHVRSGRIKALQTPELPEIWLGNGSDVATMSPPEFSKLINSEIKRWADVTKTSGAKLD